MKVGDLVRFFSDESDHANKAGIVIDVKSPAYGHKHSQVFVQWDTALCSYPERQLEVINEGR